MLEILSTAASFCPAAAFALWSLYRGLRIRKVKILTAIDGDTYETVTMRGKRYRIRILGVDCPELGQRHANVAKRYVQEKWQGPWLTLHLRGRDRYRRHLAHVRLGARDLASELIQEGLAYPLKNYEGRASRWSARLKGKGVWGQLVHTKPWNAPSRKKRWWS